MRQARLPIAGLALLLLLAEGGLAEERPGAPVWPVTVAPVTRARVAAGRTYVGSVVPSRESVVGSEFGGLVVDLLVREGQRVDAEQEIARLSSAILDLRIAAAQAERDLRAEELAELEAGSRAEEIEASRARLEQVEVEVDTLRWKLEGARRLFDGKRISEDELRDAELALRRAQASRRELAATLALLEAGARAERIEQARARLGAQTAEVSRLEEEKRRHTIRAPFAGYVVEELTERGQWLGAGSPVVRLASLDEVDFVVPILEDHVSALTLGMKVYVRLNALPDLPLQRTEATLVAIVPQADLRARTFPVKFRLTNPVEGGTVLLKAGMFGSVALPVEAEREMLLVPKDALVLGAQPIVYVVGPGDAAIPVPVQLGVAHEDLIQVTGGLEEGQQVVTRGNERLFPGARVRTLESGR